LRSRSSVLKFNLKKAQKYNIFENV